MKIDIYKQKTTYTCGPACVKMILESMGIKKSENWIAKFMHSNNKIGTKNKYFVDIAKKFKLKYLIRKNGNLAELKDLLKNKWMVIICYQYRDEDGHYSIVKKINFFGIKLIDPYIGKIIFMSTKKFKKAWRDSEENRPWLIAYRQNDI